METPELPVIEEPSQTPAPDPVKAERTWHCGTLVYTRAGLVTLFVFLLWGHFSFNLMTHVVPSILPLKLKSLGASDFLIGLLLTSVFPMFGVVVSPYLSFKSDYLRTRWGRRLPFFAFSLPLVTASILLLAFYEEITNLLRHTGLLANLSPASAMIGVVAVCTIIFQFSDVLVVSIYNYLFRDTVPLELTGRFVGLMQVVGGSVGFLYNFFIFKYAESHMKEIFIGTAIVYFIGIGMVCLFVKEGEYPPVTDTERKNSRGLAGLRTFFRESFSHKFYWTKFSYTICPGLVIAMNPFNIFFYKEMGLTTGDVGQAVAITTVTGIVAAYLASVFVDRWHPLRILAYSAVFAATLSFGGWVWIFVTLPPKAFFWLNMLGGGVIGTFHAALCRDAHMPFDMRLQPKSRYGQFCSAQSILNNGAKILTGGLAGLYFMFLKRAFFHGSNYAYRFNFIWVAVANLLTALLICSLYRQWKALGGDRHFHPPAPWSETGFEELEQTPFVGVQTRWLDYSLRITRALFLLAIVYLAATAFWLWHIGWAYESNVFLAGIIPVAIALYMAWTRVERSIRNDVALCADGKPAKNGIPHHGVFFIKAMVLLLGVPVAIGTMIVAIYNHLHVGVMVFGIASQVTNAMAMLAVLILRRLERGSDPMLDYDGRKVAVVPEASVPGCP